MSAVKSTGTAKRSEPESPQGRWRPVLSFLPLQLPGARGGRQRPAEASVFEARPGQPGPSPRPGARNDGGPENESFANREPWGGDVLLDGRVPAARSAGATSGV